MKFSGAVHSLDSFILTESSIAIIKALVCSATPANILPYGKPSTEKEARLFSEIDDLTPGDIKAVSMRYC